MRLKNFFIAVLILIIQQSVCSQATTNWLDNDLNLVNVNYTYTNLKGDRYEISNDENLVISSATLSYLRMFSKGIGGGIRLSRTVFRPKESRKRTIWSAGPKAVYFFNDSSNITPYIGTSIGYSKSKTKENETIDKWKGYYLESMGGLALSKGSFIAFFEGGINYAKGREEEGSKDIVSGSIFYFSIGFGISL